MSLHRMRHALPLRRVVIDPFTLFVMQNLFKDTNVIMNLKFYILKEILTF
jgi:hypothetical protein